MFNRKSTSLELEEAMAKNIVANELEDSYGFENISKATDFINSAAEILDGVGLQKQAEALTVVLESLAKKDKKPAKKKQKITKKDKESSSNKMVKNLKEKGWVFDADDVHCADDGCDHYNCTPDSMQDVSFSDDIDFASDFDIISQECNMCGYDHNVLKEEALSWHMKNDPAFK
jgi:hypothetical protein